MNDRCDRPPASGPDPDLDLVRRTGAGDADACAALVDRHLRPVTALARRLLCDQAEAEDVAQEVFLRVWRHAGAWRSGEARFSTWLYRVTVNLCRDRLRRRRPDSLDALPPGQEPADGRPGPDAGLHASALAARVEAALAALPERQRAAIVLCHYQDLGNIAAAQVLGVSVEALESLLSRGRRRLKALLAPELEELRGDRS